MHVVLSLGYDMPSSAGIQYSIQSHQNQEAEERRINGKSNSKLRRSQQWEGNSTDDKQKEGNSMRREKNLKRERTSLKSQSDVGFCDLALVGRRSMPFAFEFEFES